MKLLLTSIYANVAERLLELVKDKPSNSTVGFLATAAEVYEDKWFVEADRNKLKELGFNIRDITLKDKNFKELVEEMKDVDVLFVAGGNTFYLLQEIRKSGFDQVISGMKEREIVYVGSSAGSVLAGPNIGIVDFFDDPKDAPELSNYESLGLVDFVVLPHFGKEKYRDKFNQATEQAEKLGIKTKTLGDNEFLII